MPDRKITIQIDTVGNVRGLTEVESEIGRLESQASGLFSTLRAGAAIDIGGRLVGALGAIPQHLEAAVRRGVDFNAQMEQARLGIAAVLQQFQGGSFDEALARTGTLLDKLKQKAMESPATFGQLVQAYQSLAGPLQAANIPLERQLDLIVNMSQALSGLGIRSDQLLQETRALVTGNINADAAAAKILNITAADVTKAKEAGQLYEFLSGKISSFAEAGKRGAESYTTALSNLDDAIDAVLSKVTKPIFSSITTGVLDLTKAISDDSTTEALAGLGHQIAQLVKAGLDLTEWAVKNADALLFLARAATALGAGYAAVKIVDLLKGLAQKALLLNAATSAMQRETAATAASTAATSANTAARTANAAAILNEARALAQARTASAGSLRGLSGPVLANPYFAEPRNAVALNSARAMEAAGGSRLLAGLSGALGGAGRFLAGPGGQLVLMASAMALDAMVARSNANLDRYQNETDSDQGRLRSLHDQIAAMTTIDEKAKARVAIEDRLREIEHERWSANYDGDQERVSLLDTHKRILEGQLASLDAILVRNRERSALEAKIAAAAERQQAMLAKAAALPAAQSAYEAEHFRGLDTAGQLDELRKRRAALWSDDRLAQAQVRINWMPAGTERDSEQSALLDQKTKALELDREIARLEKQMAADAERQADAAKAQAEARADTHAELAIMEAKARGDDAAVTRLQRQRDIHAEMLRLMRETGATESQALAIATRKADLQARITEREQAASQGGTSASSTVATPATSQPHTGDGRTIDPFFAQHGFSVLDDRAVRVLVPLPKSQRNPSTTPDPGGAGDSGSGQGAASGADATRRAAEGAGREWASLAGVIKGGFDRLASETASLRREIERTNGAVNRLDSRDRARRTLEN